VPVCRGRLNPPDAAHGAAGAGLLNEDDPDFPQPDRRTQPQPNLRAKALALLARREHSRQELEHKLAAFAPDPVDLAAILDDFERRGWLSERRFAEQVIHARRRRFGGPRIRQELLAKGVAEDIVSETVAGLAAGELDAARAIWQKKFGTVPGSAADRARQIRFLQGRGFAMGVIMQVLKGRATDDE